MSGQLGAKASNRGFNVWDIPWDLSCKSFVYWDTPGGGEGGEEIAKITRNCQGSPKSGSRLHQIKKLSRE
jgi:hypothetical protein